MRGTETDIAYLEPRRHLRIKNPGRISISHKDFSELVVEPAGGIPGNAAHVASRNRSLYYRVAVGATPRTGHEFIAPEVSARLLDSANAIR